MANIKYLFFDCMETIVDLYDLPQENDYALWAFKDSGVEHFWNGFSDFLNSHEKVKNEISYTLEPHQEYDLIRRFELLVQKNKTISIEKQTEVVNKLHANYWKTYQSKCFVKSEVRNILKELSKKYELAVVSNFKVNGGIEQLLQNNELGNVFKFVVTSINVGWRKPHHRIYEHATNLAGCSSSEILFIGDDYENDYKTPQRMGYKTIYLDKNGAKRSGIESVSNFYELQAVLEE
ncbi:HAD family hydrolase [Paenibacillus sp. CC-CFT747]|nr:HAD family hydrolase [Paenibacillus sp. CC-CFT747]